MKSIETSRLLIRNLNRGDGPFMLDLLTQPSFIQFIGDRGVKTLEDARTSIEERVLAYAIEPQES